MEKHYWPTKAHLEELRSQGKVSYSRAVTYCAGTFGAISGLMIVLYETGNSFTASLKRLLMTGVHPEHLSEAGKYVLALIFGPLAGFVACAVLVGFLQTRFLIYFDRVLPDLSRISFKRQWTGIALLRLIFATLISGVVAGISIWLLMPLLLSSLNLSIDMLGKIGRNAAWCVTGIFCGTAILLLIVSWLTSWYSFMNSHRMSRQEYEAEARE